jgi:endonuclease YncB( thermonuclease family)
VISDRDVWAAAFLAVLLSWLPAQARGPTVEARIITCYDGDTCTVDRDILPGRDRVRLRNADAPEIKGKCPSEKALAQRARSFALQLVGKVVTLNDVKVDKYARRVDAYVIMPDGRDLGRVLIAAGLARPYSGGKRAGWCGS